MKSDISFQILDIEEKVENIKKFMQDMYFDERQLLRYEDAYYVKNDDNTLILVKFIDKNALNVTINPQTNYIMENAFLECKYVKKIIVPEGVIAIGEKAFMDCESLEELSLPNSLIKIGKNFVSGCEKLNYNLYKNGKYLGNDSNPYLMLVSPLNPQVETYDIHFDTQVIFSTAFEKCELLTTIDLPNNLKSVCTMAFSLNNNVEEVNFPDNVMFIDDYAFVNAKNIKKITLPKKINHINEKSLIGCGSLETILVDKDNKNYESEEGVLYSKGQNKLINYPISKKQERFKVKETVEEISSYAFSNNKYLKEIKLSKNLKKIGQFSFESSKKLKVINFNKKLKEINTCAFFDCKNLQTINFSKNHQCELIQRGAFSKCEKLQYFIVTDSIKKIGINAFSNCENLCVYLSENVDSESEVIKKAKLNERKTYLKKQWIYNEKNEPILTKSKK